MTREAFEEELNRNIPDISHKKYIWGAGHTTELYIQGLKRIENIKKVDFAIMMPLSGAEVKQDGKFSLRRNCIRNRMYL